MARLEILCHKEECNVVLKLGPRRVFSTWLSWICWMNPDFIDTLFLYGKWLKPRLYLKIIEHILMAISMALIPFYLQQKPLINVPGWLLLVPPILSGLINLFLVKYEQTPCNATFQLTVKTVLVIRLLAGANIIIREEEVSNPGLRAWAESGQGGEEAEAGQCDLRVLHGHGVLRVLHSPQLFCGGSSR